MIFLLVGSIRAGGGSSSGSGGSSGGAIDTSFLKASYNYTTKTEIFSKDLFAKSYIANLQKSDPVEIKIQNYIKENPEISETIIKAIIETAEESPELLIKSNIQTAKISINENIKDSFVDKVAEKVNKQLVKEGKFKAFSIDQETLGISDWLKKIIQYLIGQLFSAPTITVEMLSDYKNGISIQFITTSAGILSTKVITDYETLGQIGNGWFTWSWNAKKFTASFSGYHHSQGYHYVIVYPIIWEDFCGKDLYKWSDKPLCYLAMNIYVRGFMINIADESSEIIIKPVIQNITPESISVIPNVSLVTGHAIQIRDYTIKPIKIEKPKFLNVIPIPWAKPQAEISISDGSKITTQIVKEGSDFNVGEIKVKVSEIENNKINFSMKE